MGNSFGNVLLQMYAWFKTSTQNFTCVAGRDDSHASFARNQDPQEVIYLLFVCSTLLKHRGNASMNRQQCCYFWQLNLEKQSSCVTCISLWLCSFLHRHGCWWYHLPPLIVPPFLLVSSDSSGLSKTCPLNVYTEKNGQLTITKCVISHAHLP